MSLCRPTISVALLLVGTATYAQDVKEYLRTTTDQLASVEFRSGVSELGIFSSISNAVFRPEGKAPPYPIVVLGHTCGGVGRPHIRERMRELLDAGFAVLALDSFGPRGIDNCRNQTRIRSSATVMDAYHALTHLTTLPEIDKFRIYFAGYSWGGVVAPLLASPQSAEAFGSKLRYRALVSNYGGCSYQHSASTPRLFYLLKDTDRPILMLLASEDKEFKVSDCLPVLDELKAAGKPVEWHVYEGTYHAWDQSNTGYSVTTGWNETNFYRYSGDATSDSTKRMIAFFNEHR